MAPNILLPVRIAQGVFALVTMGLSSYVAHWYNNDTLTASPSQVNFLIFVSLWSFISIAYLELAPRFMAKASHPFAVLGFNILTMLFYFAGFIALAVFLGKLLFCRGSVCAAARADAAFAAFSWLLWTASSALVALQMFKGGLAGMKTDRQAKTAMKETPQGLGA
ncbi:membrane-associating domain-containing protein [Rhexocercosporidium sp. MPI-PUGE-AT-0058]|nr:membrane-associating domain-containing protein [Rhexocercosporidium sp. MPI-PUGE-AT-0058]